MQRTSSPNIGKKRLSNRKLLEYTACPCCGKLTLSNSIKKFSTGHDDIRQNPKSEMEMLKDFNSNLFMWYPKDPEQPSILWQFGVNDDTCVRMDGMYNEDWWKFWQTFFCVYWPSYGTIGGQKMLEKVGNVYEDASDQSLKKTLILKKMLRKYKETATVLDKLSAPNNSVSALAPEESISNNTK